MEFNYIEDGIDAVVIDNFYTEQQLHEIMNELKWLTKPAILQTEETLSPGLDDSGNSLTSKTGIFLEEVFKNWKHSALIKSPIDNFALADVKKKLFEFNPLFKIMYNCDTRTHLVSYYQDSDFYKPHNDLTVFTILNYFFTEPKQFSGGDIKLFSSSSNKIADIETKHNRVVLIAGCTIHEVTKIKSNLNKLSGDGRYCNAIFLNMLGNMRADLVEKTEQRRKL